MATAQDASHVILLIAGAVALLLWGTRMARTGVTRAYGSEIRRFLSSGLSNRCVAALSGFGAAAVMQSSMAVALFVASFTRMRGLRVETGLAVLLGADIGSAVVASLLSLEIKQFWPVLAGCGYIVHSYYDGRNAKGKHFGRVLLGLGLVLLALSVLGMASQSVASSELFKLVLLSLAGQHLLCLLLVALMTWFAHSSIVMLLLLASMASAGVVTDPVLIVVMILGINVGGGIPAILLTWNETAAARRMTVGNGLFRLCGAMAALLFATDIGAVYAGLPFQPAFSVIALHLVFNLGLIAAFLPLTTPAARLLTRMVSDTGRGANDFGPLYIASGTVTDPPSLAISSLLRETVRMIEIVEDMLGKCRGLLGDNDMSLARTVHDLDNRLDTLYEAIKAYATNLSREDVEVDESRRAVDIISYAANLENAGDLIEKNLLDTFENKARTRAQFSDAGRLEIEQLFDFVNETARVAAATTINWEKSNAALLLERKSRCKEIAKQSLNCHLARLRAGTTNSVETSSFHMDILGDIQRINSLLCGIGYSVRQTPPV